MQIDWPDNEPIPRSIHEALRLGWQVTDWLSEQSEDLLHDRGQVFLKKTIRGAEFVLSVPFAARYTYAKPSEVRVTVEIKTQQQAGAWLQ